MVITNHLPYPFLSILIHLRVVNLPCLKQRFDDCLFEVSFYPHNLFFFYNLFYQSLYIYYTLHFTIVARSHLKVIKKQLNAIK